LICPKKSPVPARGSDQQQPGGVGAPETVRAPAEPELELRHGLDPAQATADG
jgi:hypothetical protein